MSKPKSDFFKFVVQQGIHSFVETGLWHGGGVTMALNTGFRWALSFDVVEELVQECTKKFEHQIAEGKVNLVLGDSGVELPKRTKDIPGDALFFLDAHFQGLEAKFEAANCPLVDEIAAIKARNNPGDVILIDDLRLLKDRSAWKGHETEIDRVIGDLQLYFPDSVGFLLEGFIEHDVYCLMPSEMATAFFRQFPGGKISSSGSALQAPQLSSVEVQSSTEQAPLYVFAGGHNTRIGNFLPMYGRLLKLAENHGRTLHFPFAERAISTIFAPSEPSLFKEIASDSAFGRLIRSAQEEVERSEQSEAYQYSDGVLHEFHFDILNTRVLFGRGKLDWDREIRSGRFAGRDTIVLSDPHPFTLEGVSQAESIELLKDRLSLREDVLSNAVKGMELDAEPSDRKNIALHWRQGDFARWAGGRYNYDAELVRTLLDMLITKCRRSGRNVKIFLATDGAFDDSLKFDEVVFVQNPMAETFATIASCELVLSNSSTFSSVASSVGSIFLENKSTYLSLGEAVSARDTLAKLLDSW